MHDNRYSRHITHITERQADGGIPDDEDEVFLRRRSGPLKSPVDPYLSEDEVKVMRRATRVMMYVWVSSNKSMLLHSWRFYNISLLPNFDIIKSALA